MANQTSSTSQQLVISDSERAAWVAELTDPNKVLVYCEQHNYAGSGKRPPTSGCASCWNVFYTVLLAETPPHKRAESLAKLHEIVSKMATLIERGQWHFQPYRHAKITIEKG